MIFSQNVVSIAVRSMLTTDLEGIGRTCFAIYTAPFGMMNTITIQRNNNQTSARADRWVIAETSIESRKKTERYNAKAAKSKQNLLHSAM